MRIDPPALADRSVHVWACDLSRSVCERSAEEMSRELCAFERDRLARLVFARDQTRYLFAHHWMRKVLSAYVAVTPGDLRMQEDAQGKPAFDGEFGISFNLSHSEHAVLLAISRNRFVGIDVEVMDAHRDLEDTARGVYTALELAQLGETRPPDFQRAFLTLWTRKEAVLKAMGVGLSADPARLHVGLENCQDSRRTRVAVPRGPYGDAIDVADLHIAPDWVSAVAQPGGWDDVQIFQTSQMDLN